MAANETLQPSAKTPVDSDQQSELTETGPPQDAAPALKGATP